MNNLGFPSMSNYSLVITRSVTLSTGLVMGGIFGRIGNFAMVGIFEIAFNGESNVARKRKKEKGAPVHYNLPFYGT